MLVRVNFTQLKLEAEPVVKAQDSYFKVVWIICSGTVRGTYPVSVLNTVDGGRQQEYRCRMLSSVLLRAF